MSDVRALNCTSCGAPLELKGGHNVRSITCSYCGAVMDSHDGYRAVATFKGLDRPHTPYQIGMTGTIFDVEFTVIGMIGYELWEDGTTYGWVSSQLFSPTHGYAWITYNDGHTVFSRRVRELPDRQPPKKFKHKRRLTFRGETYRIFERYTATITYVEGELTWIARQGDQVSVTEAINPPKLLEIEETALEMEFGLSHYLTRDEAAKAFALDEALPPPRGVHPAQPFTPYPVVQSLAKVGQIFCIVSALGFVAWAVFGSGQTIAERRIERPTQSAAVITFTVDDPDQLIEVGLHAPVNNSWLYVEGTVEAAERVIAAIGREIDYYHGVEDGDHWTEGNRFENVTFKVPTSGDYTLTLEAEGQSDAIPWLEVDIRQGVMPLRYLIALLIISVVSALSLVITRAGFERRRWGDDDDDD